MKKILKVFICCQKYIHRVKDIKARVDKWGLGDYLIFVGGEDQKELEPNVIQLKCRDLYEDLPEKMFSIYKYLSNHGYPERYEYFWKIDDDVDFIRWNPQREQSLLESLSGLDYAGFKLITTEGKRGWHIGRVQEDSPWYNKRYNGSFVNWLDGGSTYFLSSRSMSCFLNYKEINIIRYKEIWEDLAVAKFLKKCNILPIHIEPWTDKPVLKFNINK
jgi:hypothetical protein